MTKRTSLAWIALLALALTGAGPLSGQGPRSAPTTGYIDPTVTGFNGGHPLVTCSSGCSAATINQNTDALQKAVDLANVAPHPWIHIPPGEYPVMRGGATHNLRYGVLISGYSDIVVDGAGAIIRATGNCGQGDYFTFQIDSGSHNLRFLPGLVLSQRDLTNCSEHTHDFEVGFGTNVDDIQWRGVVFTEQVAGDCIEMTGGVDNQHLVSRLTVVGDVFDCHRSGLGYQHGTTMVNAVANWFGPTITDQAIDHEPTSPGGNNYEFTLANVLFRSGNTNIYLTQSGNGNAPTDENVVGYNIILGTVNALNLTRTWFVGNSILVDTDTQSDSDIELFKRATDMWVLDNFATRGAVYAPAGPIFSDTDNNGYAPNGLWLRGNRFLQYGGGEIVLTCVAKASMVDTDWIAIFDGTTTVNYEFDVAGDGCTGGRTCVNISGDTTAADVCTHLRTAVVATQATVAVADNSGSVVLTGGTGANALTATRHIGNAGFLSTPIGVGSGAQLDGVSNFYVSDNTFSYHGITPDGNSSGYIGVLARSQLQDVSGTITGNRVLRRLQADNVTQAGRAFVGYDASADTYPHLGHITLRDNFVDGARDELILTETALDEGQPVISGNVMINTSVENLPASWRTESTLDAETVASGALSPSKRTSYLAPASNGTTHSLADGAADGLIKHLKWVASGGDDTVTPAHFGDGTSISVSVGQAAAGARADLVWDATGGVWRLLGSSNITVNP